MVADVKITAVITIVVAAIVTIGYFLLHIPMAMCQNNSSRDALGLNADNNTVVSLVSRKIPLYIYVQSKPSMLLLLMCMYIIMILLIQLVVPLNVASSSFREPMASATILTIFPPPDVQMFLSRSTTVILVKG